MICIKPHCGECHHMCVKSPMFKTLDSKERVEILLTDFLIELNEEEKKSSGVVEIKTDDLLYIIENRR